MQHRLLCAHQARWLLQKPHRVLSLWEGGMRAAQRSMARGKWYAALLHAARARECARLMVADARHCDRRWLTRHAGSEALLRLINARLAAAADSTKTVH